MHKMTKTLLPSNPTPSSGHLEDLIQQSVPQDHGHPVSFEGLKEGDQIIFSYTGSRRIMSGTVVSVHSPDRLKLLGLANMSTQEVRKLGNEITLLKKDFRWIYRNSEMWIAPQEEELIDDISPDLSCFPRNALIDFGVSFNRYHNQLSTGTPFDVDVFAKPIMCGEHAKFYQRYIPLQSGMFIHVHGTRYVIVGMWTPFPECPVFIATDLRTSVRFMHGIYLTSRYLVYPQELTVTWRAGYRLFAQTDMLNRFIYENAGMDSLIETTRAILQDQLHVNEPDLTEIVASGLTRTPIYQNEIDEMWIPRAYLFKDGKKPDVWIEEDDCMRVYKKGVLDLGSYR